MRITCIVAFTLLAMASAAAQQPADVKTESLLKLLRRDPESLEPFACDSLHARHCVELYFGTRQRDRQGKLCDFVADRDSVPACALYPRSFRQ